MYLHLLDHRQRTTFFQAAKLLAHSDGIHPSELKVLNDVQAEWGIEAVEVFAADVATIVSELAEVEPEAARRAVGLELAGVVAADGVVSDEETELYSAFGEALGLNEISRLRALELAISWVRVSRTSEEFVAGR